MDDFPIPKWITYIGFVLFGIAGGIIGYSIREQQKGEKIVWSRAVLEGLASGFVGILVLLLSVEMGFSMMWAGFLVGVFGWIGATASIGVFNRIIASRAGFDMPKDKENEK